MVEVKQNEKTFEVLYEGKKAGFMEYNQVKDGILEITHTEVSEDYGGQGLGKELVNAAVEFAQNNDLKIRSLCSYAKKIIERSPEHKELLLQ